MAAEESDGSDQDAEAPQQARRPVNIRAGFGGIVLLLAIAGLVGAGLSMRRETGSIPGLDADLCPTDEAVAASATYLVDLRKPVDQAELSLPGDRLRDVTQSLRENAELLVYTLGSDGDAPRQRMGRLCKPYSNAAIQALAKDGGEVRDCDDIPTQVSASTRVAARLFCERREALATRITELSATEPETPLTNAHLIEALDDTALEFESRQRPYELYVLSDMLTHADWFSHFDIDWTSWQFADLASLRTRNAPAVESHVFSNADVVIFHIARRNLTEQPRPRRALREFWGDYFENQAIDFVDQPTMDGYDATPLLKLDSEEERVRFLLDQERASLAQERERLRQQAARLVELEARLMRQANEAGLTDADLADAEDADLVDAEDGEDVLEEVPSPEGLPSDEEAGGVGTEPEPQMQDTPATVEPDAEGPTAE